MPSYATYAGSFAALGSFAFGFDTGIVTTSIAHATFKQAMGNPNAALTGAIVSTYIAGEAVGAVSQMALGDRMGRRRFMQAMAICVLIGSILQTAAQNYGMFLAGRIVAGFGIGGLAGTAPVYNAEMAPPANRGFVGGLVGQMIVIGSCLANWLGFFCSYAAAGQFQWRFPLSLQIPPAIMLIVGLQWILPESPRWCLAHGREDEALASYSKMRSDLSKEDLQVEFLAMKEQILFEKRTLPATWGETWRRYRKRVLVCVLVQAMTSAAGINVINYYQTSLYTSLGVKGHKIILLSAIYGTVGLIANVISIRIVDRIGRRIYLIAGMGGLAVVLIYTALLTHFYQASTNTAGKSLAILGFYLYTAIYYGCINSTTWLYGVEVVPLHLRSRIMGLASCAHFIINVALTQAGPSAFATIKANYYYVFVGCCTFSCAMIILYFPETKNLSLEAIAVLFGDKVVQEVEEAETNLHQDVVGPAGLEKNGGDIRHIENGGEKL
ncbi:general substrate transporter [Meredithblackwellia eburnea MCA 4105]